MIDEQPGVRWRGEGRMTGGDAVWWTGGLDPRRPRPLAVVVTGALGRPERHLPLLKRLVRRGHAVVATSPPTAAHHSGLPLSRLIDRFAPLAVTARTCVIGFDLGGIPALAAASGDERIRVTQVVGTPVARLFDEPELLLSLPTRNLDALVRATGAPRRELLPEALGGFALRAETLYPLPGLVRVAYTADDPLTPPQDLALLKLALARSEFRAFPGRGDGTAPAGRPLRRWLVEGARTGPRRAPR
ncbi:hypothetical protein [Streptomyces bungoensis]|uniref:hypothetical protein n=1 Tax=Streptomyces bungoensis TaxID=285568 RepID=UPI00340E9D63